MVLEPLGVTFNLSFYTKFIESTACFKKSKRILSEGRSFKEVIRSKLPILPLSSACKIPFGSFIKESFPKSKRTMFLEPGHVAENSFVIEIGEAPFDYFFHLRTSLVYKLSQVRENWFCKLRRLGDVSVYFLFLFITSHLIYLKEHFSVHEKHPKKNGESPKT